MIVDLKASSNIEQADYDEETRELRVTFKSGATYVYFQVPSNVIYNWTIAASVGSYFCSTIRSAGYTYVKL